MPCDLHIHTVYSDGTYTPEKIVKVAKKVGLTTIAITDHDTTMGLAEAEAAAQKYGVEVVPGIEFTTESNDLEIHILGYFINRDDADFQAILTKLRDSRKERIYKMVDKLKGLGIRLKAREVLREARTGSPGRPHLARVMVREGICANLAEAFQKYLAFGGPAYVEHYKLLPKDAIELIKKVKGVPVLAHPRVLERYEAREKLAKLVGEWAGLGLQGIEVFYPTHRDVDKEYYLALTKKYNLVPTGGSDFHGEASVREIIFGEFTLDDKHLDQLKLKAGV